MIFSEKFRNSNMITWNITNFCNFQCEYCINSNADDLAQIEGIDFLTQKKGFDSLGKDWIIHITGGEPFLMKEFINLCENISTNHYISLNTNLTTANIYQFADHLNPEKVLFISSSVHILEREKRDPNLKKYIEKIIYLQEKRFNIIASYVAFPSVLSRIKDDFKTLKDGGVQNLQFKGFRGLYNKKVYPYAYSDEDISILKTLPYEYPEFEILKGEYSFFGHNCGAGNRFFVMDEFGNLKRCSSLHREYGNLFKGGIKRDINPKPCPLRNCGCPYEGIRNVDSSKKSNALLINEVMSEGYFQMKRIIRNPTLLLSLKDKLSEHFQTR
jgi:MoaA/NifB/PqqE/SkfB family radical SAM enzyme